MHVHAHTHVHTHYIYYKHANSCSCMKEEMFFHIAVVWSHESVSHCSTTNLFLLQVLSKQGTVKPGRFWTGYYFNLKKGMQNPSLGLNAHPFLEFGLIALNRYCICLFVPGSYRYKSPSEGWGVKCVNTFFLQDMALGICKVIVLFPRTSQLGCMLLFGGETVTQLGNNSDTLVLIWVQPQYYQVHVK